MRTLILLAVLLVPLPAFAAGLAGIRGIDWSGNLTILFSDGTVMVFDREKDSDPVEIGGRKSNVRDTFTTKRLPIFIAISGDKIVLSSVSEEEAQKILDAKDDILE